MSKHIIDRPRGAAGAGRILPYLTLARRAGPAANTRLLWQRPVMRDDTGRLRACLRIARGRFA